MDYTPTDSELTMSIAEYQTAESKPTSASKKATPPLTASGPQQAVFRCGVGETAPQLWLDWSSPTMRLELRSRAGAICAGPLEHAAVAQGSALAAAGDWSEICREDNEQAHYLEWELPLDQGFHLQRQLVVLPQEEVFFLGDALLGPAEALPENAAGNLEYRLRLPLAQGVAFTPAEKTFEGTLGKRRPLAQVFPLALPEWRRGAQGGALSAAGQHLELSLQGTGSRLYAPLLCDLRARRFRQPFTWRRLTVAEHLRAMPADLAVGYRAQLGKLHLLVYRSLGPCGNRTVLGHNLCSEFLLARFSSKGEVESWMEIDS